MRLKDRSVAKHGQREGAYSRLSLRFILCVVFGAGCAFTSAAKNVHAEPSIESLDARIAVLQKRVDSFTTVVKQLRDDSAKTVAPAVPAASPQAKQLSDINDALAKNKSAAADLKASYDKARQDSAALAASFRDRLAALRKTGDSLDKAIAAMRAVPSTAPHVTKRDSAADERTIIKLQGDAVRYDSLLHARQHALQLITGDIEKLRQDSIQAEKQRSDDRNRFTGQVHALDSQIMISDAEISKATATRMAGKMEKTQKIAQLQENVKQMGSQKQQHVERISGLNKDVGILGTERADLAKSTGEEQNKYAALRAPYDEALAKADTEVQTLSQDKPILEALKMKLNLDKEITDARELLDKAIQAQAEKKKGSKALVDTREANLDTLLSTRDSIVGTTTGLREREAAFRATTSDVIAPLVDSTLATVTASLAAAESRRDLARKNLAQFEQANPPVKGPAPQRLALIDSMITSKKKEAIQLTELNDSLSIQLEEAQKSLTDLTAGAQAETGAADSLMQLKNSEKATLAKTRAKLQRDSIVADSTDAASILSIRNKLDGTAKQKTAIQGEIDNIGAALAKNKLDLSAVQGRNKQAAATVAAEKARADSLAATRQKLSAQLTDDQAKNAQAIAALETQQNQQIKATAGPIARYAGSIAENAKATAAFQASADSLRKASSSGKQSTQDAVKRISMELASANKIVDNAQRDIAALKSKRETLAAEAAQKQKDLDQAMKQFNDIYALLADKHIDEANKQFKDSLTFLKKNLDDEHFKAIKATIDRMMKEKE